MEKVIESGKVAVVITNGYGGGWSSWGAPIELVFHPLIVEMVRNNRKNEICPEWLAANFGEEYASIYCGSVHNLAVVWVPEGALFRIEEYDGWESIVMFNRAEYITA